MISYIWPLDFSASAHHLHCRKTGISDLCGTIGKHSAAIGNCVCAAGFAERHRHKDPSPRGPCLTAQSDSQN